MATRAEWIERVRRCERSGLELAELARREGIKPKQLSWEICPTQPTATRVSQTRRRQTARPWSAASRWGARNPAGRRIRCAASCRRPCVAHGAVDMTTPTNVAAANREGRSSLVLTGPNGGRAPSRFRGYAHPTQRAAPLYFDRFRPWIGVR